LEGHQVNDTLEFFYTVGGGGGHTITIHSFKVKINYIEKKNEESENVSYEVL